MNHTLSLEQGLTPLRLLQPQLNCVLRDHGLSDTANRIDTCKRNTPCRSRRCIVCTSLRSIAQRSHLKQHVRRLFGQASKPTVYAITPTVLDSAIQHRQRALDLVSGTRALMRKLAASSWFATTETLPSMYGDSSLRTHTHVLAVLNTPASGRGFVRQSKWQERIYEDWQSICPAIAQDADAKRLLTVDDALRWSAYATKGASLQDCAIRNEAALREPESFMAASAALWNVAQFFGPLALGYRSRSK